MFYIHASSMHRESKTDSTGPLRQYGGWEESNKRREELKTQSMAASQPWIAIAAEFPLQNGSSHNGTSIKADVTRLQGQAVGACRWLPFIRGVMIHA